MHESRHESGNPGLGSSASGPGDEMPCPQRPPLSQLLHDLNQPLSAINNYAQAGLHLIDNRLADEARLKELFAKIVAQSARAAALSQDMRQALAHTDQQAGSTP